MTTAGSKAVITAGEHTGKEGIFIRFNSASKTMFGVRPAICRLFCDGQVLEVAPTDYHTVWTAELDAEAMAQYDFLCGVQDDESGYAPIVSAEVRAARRAAWAAEVVAAGE